MTKSELSTFIQHNYLKLRDTAGHYCRLNRIDSYRDDLLNEVLIMILEQYDKAPERFEELYRSKELMYYIKGQIRINAFSPTAPFRHKYCHEKTDSNIDFNHMKIEDEQIDEEQEDKAGRIVQQMNKVRETISKLGLSKEAISIFEYKFFNGESLQTYKSKTMCTTEVYATYKKVLEIVKGSITGKQTNGQVILF